MFASFRALVPVVLTLTIPVLGACEEEDDDHHEEADDHHEEEGVATESICPPNSDLSYESFGQSFMTTYCTHCHSSTLTGAARNGAPDGHDFDTLDGILLVAGHIDEYAAAGPAATNTEMPPSDPRPSDAEREQLGEWLACEMESP